MGTVLASATPAGSLPLPQRRELYARARAMNFTPWDAARKAGYDPQDGAATRLERSKKVQARMVWFARQDEDLLREKRAELEGFLWSVHRANYKEFWEGKRLKDFDELPEHMQMLVESLKFTEKGKPILSVYSKMQANMELRKLNMIGGGNKVEAAEGADDYGRLTDAELVEAIARQARELGRYDQLFASIGGRTAA